MGIRGKRTGKKNTGFSVLMFFEFGGNSIFGFGCFEVLVIKFYLKFA